MNSENAINSNSGRNSSARSGRTGGSGKKKSKGSKFWSAFAVALVMICLVALVVLGLSQLFQSKETHTSSNTDTVSAKAMVCETEAPKDPFFAVDGATDVEHTIKVTYKNGVAEKLNYEYDADFASEEEVTKAEARTHADYNTYMGQNASDFTTNFMPMGDEYKITIYTDAGNLGSKTARMFFISEEEFTGMDELEIDNLKRIFQGAGFHCEMDDD